MYAQRIQRVYPDYNHSALYGVVSVGSNTFYAAGSNSTLLRSSTGGSWEPMPMGDHRIHITHLTTDLRDLYMLAAPYQTEGQPALWPDKFELQLFHFDTQFRVLRHVPFPLLDTADIDYISNYDLAATSQALYLSYFGNKRRVLRSVDGGEHWEDLSFPDSIGFYVTFHTIRDSDDILVHMRRSEGSKLYLSTDHGDTWATRDCPKTQIGDPIQYLGDGRVVLQSFETGSMMLSDSTGVWKDLGAPPFTKAACLARVASGAVLAVSGNRGFFVSQDEGAHWTNVRSEVVSDGFSVACDAFGSDGFIVADRFGRITLTSDGGLTWEEARNIDVMYSNPQMADAENGILLGGRIDEHGAKYFLTRDGFQSLEPCPPFRLYRPFMRTPQLWYSAGTSNAFGDSLLCRSEDGGNTWELVLEMENVKASRLIQPADTNSIALSTSNGLLFSPDRGESWSWVIEADWESSAKPYEIHIDSPGEPIWMITPHSNPYYLLRSDVSWSAWDTVYAVPDEEISDTWRIQDLTRLRNGDVYMLQMLGKTGGIHFRVVFSDDDGDSWQSWMATQDGHSGHSTGRITILENGAMISSWEHFLRNSLHPFLLYFSGDGLQSEQVFYEQALVQNVDRSGYDIVVVDSTTGYLVTGMGIYRITMPEVTNVRSPQRPPLPLSIATPYPHPISKHGGLATLFIQSERSEHVQMTVHDLSGRELKLLYSGELAPEGRYVSWHTRGLAPGTYLLQLISIEAVCTRKVVLE